VAQVRVHLAGQNYTPTEAQYHAKAWRIAIDDPDVQYFRRARVCLNCGHQWLTAEVPETLLEELARLRDSDSVDDANALEESLGKVKKWLSYMKLLARRRDPAESHLSRELGKPTGTG
jgi:hypothetical protein